MGAELGRVSGALLTKNLLRNGIDLSFQDTDLSTPVLHLDVTSGLIGVNTDSPTHPILVDGTISSTNLIVDTTTRINTNFLFELNEISHALDSIYIRPDQTTNPRIVATGLTTDSLKLNNNTFLNLVTDSHVELSPNGTGVVSVTGELRVNGSVHATGDITWDGDITLGSDTNDNVTFVSEVASNINPNDINLSLGSLTKKWSELNTVLVNGDAVSVSSLVPDDIDILLRPGNTYYVSINGDDTYVGDHLHATFRTVKHALSVATAGDEIVIFPGDYEEEFPLTIPQGVAVRGTGIRDVSIRPTPSTNTQDAFLLNGETTVSFLTIKNFLYDSVNDTGYAFKFAPSIQVTTRSPYIFNVTVLTLGSSAILDIIDGENANNIITSILDGGSASEIFSGFVDTGGATLVLGNPLDPLGFNDGDAGRGALLDASVAHPDSAEAAGLFFSVTFITPNADALTVTNGARCEWLNSFTYYANKGINLVRGTAGFANLGLKFTSEVRSINSANVYGNYGAYADGLDTLAYLIGHNFGYIGTGANSENDISLVIQANEVVAVNDGQIYYDSMDHKGDFRIGDIFYVNQETGNVTFNAQTLDFGASGSISIEGSGGQLYINSTEIIASNIRIHDNNIDSLSGPVNILAASNTTNLDTDVNITGNLAITGDVVVGGNVFLGDGPLDTLTISPRLTETIEPNVTDTYTLGTSSKKWRNVYLHSTFDIANNFTANSVNVLTGYFQVPNIKIEGNELSVTSTNSDLNLLANGTGGVQLDAIKITSTTISNAWTLPTNDTEKSVIFSPNGTGNTVLDTTTALKIPAGTNANRTLSQNGEIRFNSTYNLFDGYQSTNKVSLSGVWDSDRNTYITAELTPGTNDNTLRFGINSTVKATINSTALTTNTVYVDNVSINGNAISNRVTSNDLTLAPTGTGVVNVNSVHVIGNTITNTTNSALILSNLGTGYVKFSGTGIVIPTGDTSERRLTPETGEMRYNSELEYTEIYNGTAWQPVKGSNPELSREDIIDIMDIWTFILA